MMRAYTNRSLHGSIDALKHLLPLSSRSWAFYMKGNHNAHGFNTKTTATINASITRTIFTVDCIFITPFFLFLTGYSLY